MSNATTAFRDVASQAEMIRNDEPAIIEMMDPGDVVRQGDVHIIRIDRLPKDLKPFGSRQLAPGTTQGSRHVAEGPCEVLAVDEADALAILHRLIPQTKDHRQFVGPAVRASGPWTVAHPEHGDRTFPAGSYLTTYQKAFAETIRRQAD